MDFDPARVRPTFAADPFGSYHLNMLLGLRLVLSLRRVATTLPVTLLASGGRLSKWEELFIRLGVRVVDGHSVPTPRWASPWHTASFSTLALLSRVEYESLIFLEMDTIVTANIDHLASGPAPSFANYFDPFACVGPAQARGN